MICSPWCKTERGINMARPQKDGVDYFPFDTVLDTKFELIEAEFGLAGFALVVKLFQKIYGELGYYCEWTDEVALLFAKKNNAGGNVVSELIDASIRRGIFNRDLYEKYKILTSAGIQKRYFEAVSRRAQIEVKKEYLLVSDIQKYKNVDINSINVCNNSINVCNNSQSKVKESKVNKIKEEERIKRASPSVIEAYEENISLISTVVMSEISDWLERVDESLIIYAIEEAVKNNVRRWKYIEGILNKAYSDGCKTKEDKEKQEKARSMQASVTKSGKLNLANNYKEREGLDDKEKEMIEKRRKYIQGL